MNPTDYHAVIIKPIRTDLLADEWHASMSGFIATKEIYNKKAREVADYFRQQLIEDINNYPNAQYTVADIPGHGVATVEIVLTELEFSHPVARAGTLAIPIPGIGTALSTVSDPHAAFALRLSDSETGKLLVTVGDRKFSPIRLLDLNKLTVCSSVREICANWATELSAGLNEGHFGKVEKVGVFRLLPW